MTIAKNINSFVETKNRIALATKDKQKQLKLNFEIAFATPTQSNNKITVYDRKIAVTPKQLRELCPEMEKKVIQNILFKYGSSGAKLPKNMKCVFKSLPKNMEAIVLNETPNEIHINIDKNIWLEKRSVEDLKNLLTHETLHSASNAFSILINKKDFVFEMKEHSHMSHFILNEGFTEYFTERLNGKSGNAGDKEYDIHLKYAKAIVADVGEDTVRKAYFKGDAVAVDKMIKSLAKLEKRF